VTARLLYQNVPIASPRSLPGRDSVVQSSATTTTRGEDAFRCWHGSTGGPLTAKVIDRERMVEEKGEFEHCRDQ